MNSLSPINTSGGMSAASSNGGSVSPRQAPSPKNVAFELLFLESPQYRARLPMRVQIYPHDTTDSIVTTVKNFYGLYSGPPGSKGVSFEDELGNTLIARYENFRNNMIVYVRVIEEAPVGALESHHYRGLHMGADSYYGGDGYAIPQRYGPEMARSYSTSPRRRSPSPRGRRSDSSSTNGKKGRSRSTKSRSLHNHTDAYAESMNGYSSGDGAPSTASARAKEQLGTTDISVENIVEGGRRKRAKFESSVSLAHHHYKRFFAILLTLFFFFSGTASIRTASDAGRYFEPIRLSGQTYRTSQTVSVLRTDWPKPFYKPTTAALSAELR